MAQEVKASTLSVIAPVTTQNAPEVAITQGCEQYRPLVSKYDWPVNTVLAIMKAESGCGQFALNGQDNHKTCVGSYGLMQLACLHFTDGQDKFDPETNIAVAYRIYSTSTFSPWSAFTNGSYLKYL